jgi:hypothetical protein
VLLPDPADSFDPEEPGFVLLPDPAELSPVAKTSEFDQGALKLLCSNEAIWASGWGDMVTTKETAAIAATPETAPPTVRAFNLALCILNRSMALIREVDLVAALTMPADRPGALRFLAGSALDSLDSNSLGVFIYGLCLQETSYVYFSSGKK